MNLLWQDPQPWQLEGLVRVFEIPSMTLLYSYSTQIIRDGRGEGLTHHWGPTVGHSTASPFHLNYVARVKRGEK